MTVAQDEDRKEAKDNMGKECPSQVHAMKIHSSPCITINYITMNYRNMSSRALHPHQI
jgi:hypothetical protein